MIRQATLDDLKALTGLYKELMTYHHDLDPKNKIPTDEKCLDDVKSFFELDIFEIICHESNGIIDGMVVYIIANPKVTAENRCGSLIINDLIVTEKSRGQGIGTEMLNELFNIAKEKYCDSAVLEVHTLNDSAKKFYEKVGLLPRSIKLEKRL